MKEKEGKKIRNTKTEDICKKDKVEAEYDRLEAWIRSLEVRQSVLDEDIMVNISDL